MATRYFPHDVDAQRSRRLSKLVSVLGWKGYGLYWALIELMVERDECQLEYDLNVLRRMLQTSKPFLERLIKDFDLFVFSDDGTVFWSASARRRVAIREQRKDAGKAAKRGRPRKDAETASATVEPVRVDADEVDRVDMEKEPESDRTRDDVEDSTARPVSLQQVERIKDAWNERFASTPREVVAIVPSPLALARLRESCARYELNDFKTAFRIAEEDDFCWQFEDCLKTENIARLLTKAEQKKKKKAPARRFGGESDYEAETIKLAEAVGCEF